MLVVTRFARACSRSRSTFSDSAQAELQRLGDFTNARRLRWNSLAAASAWSGHREEREYKADRATTRRYERPRKPASFKRRIARRNQAIRFAAKGSIRRDVAGHGREIGDNPDCAAGSNPHRLLDLHDISA